MEEIFLLDEILYKGDTNMYVRVCTSSEKGFLQGHVTSFCRSSLEGQACWVEGEEGLCWQLCLHRFASGAHEMLPRVKTLFCQGISGLLLVSPVHLTLSFGWQELWSLSSSLTLLSFPWQLITSTCAYATSISTSLSPTSSSQCWVCVPHPYW